MATEKQPLLNPVLSLRVEPKPVDPETGGKSRAQINTARIAGQRKALHRQFNTLRQTIDSRRSYNGLLPIAVKMFDDAYAPSKTPNDFFIRNAQARIVSPMRKGYLVEVNEERLELLAEAAINDDTVNSQVDLSNIESVSFYSAEEASTQSIKSIWDDSSMIEGGRLIRVIFLPYRDRAARREVMDHLNEQVSKDVFQPIDMRPNTPTLALSDEGSSLAEGMRNYRNTPRGQATIVVETIDKLRALAASGAVFRFNPVSPITATSPGSGAEPEPDPNAPAALNYPIVGVIDGGLTARRYVNQVAWIAKPFVTDGDADSVHGNEIASLVVQGYEWNNNLSLPELNCRIGVAQAIAKGGCATVYSDDSFLSYLKQLFKTHPEVKVWNMSFNQKIVCEEDEFSDLGHRIAVLAREHGVLPVISIGNSVSTPDSNRMYPPGDCEAAITVSGRVPDESGKPDTPSEITREGPGPQGILKPELSSFASMRVIGGKIGHGSSYSATNPSVIAAHTFDNLKEPSPDLVKALMINKTDMHEFCKNRGWGTPDHDTLPWMCPSDSVTLAWTDLLQPGKAYYWEDIPITDSMIKDGGLYGVASLTAILNPHGMVTQGSGANYFSCRVAVSLQYKNGRNAHDSLLGQMKISEMPEQYARTEHHKWNPVKHYVRDFTHTPLAYSGDSFRLYARVFARDLYLYNLHRNEEVQQLPVAFVLTLKSLTSDPKQPLYQEMKNTLGTFVESAVVDQDIDISV